MKDWFSIYNNFHICYTRSRRHNLMIYLFLLLKCISVINIYSVEEKQ